MVKDAAVFQEGDPEAVILFQDQCHAIGGAAVWSHRVLDCKHVLAVLHQSCMHGLGVSSQPGEVDVVQSFDGGREDACSHREGINALKYFLIGHVVLQMKQTAHSLL